MACPMSSNREIFQGPLLDTTPDVILPCVLSQGGDGIPRSTSFDQFPRPRAMIAVHALRRPTVSASPKVMMVCHAQRRSTLFVVQGL